MIRRLSLLIVIAATACSRAAMGHGNTIVFASGADLESINPLLTMHPLAHQVQRYVLLTTLVQYDSALQIQPYLARRWEWSRDSTRLTMHLTDQVHWHDGVPTTAHDAAWTLEAARDPATGYPRLSDLAYLASAAAPDDTTLVLTFRAPQPAVPDVLTDLAILPEHRLGGTPHAALRTAAWNQSPLGNGPFRFVSHTPNRRWVFTADPTFPALLGGPPHIDRFVLAVVDEPTTKLAALTSGELDFAGIQPAHASFVRSDPHLAVVQYPLRMTYVLLFNTRRRPLNDVRVRRAISGMIDRRAIVAGYLFGFGTPADGPIPSADTSTAAATPVASSWHADHPVSFELLTVGSGEAALEQMLQGQLAAGGIRVTIRQLELSAFLSRVEGPAHDFDAAVMGVSGDAGMGQFAPMLNTAGIRHDDDRAAMLRLFADSMPVAFLYHAGGVQGMNRRVRGVHMDIRGELATLRQWYLAP